MMAVLKLARPCTEETARDEMIALALCLADRKLHLYWLDCVLQATGFTWIVLALCLAGHRLHLYCLGLILYRATGFTWIVFDTLDSEEVREVLTETRFTPLLRVPSIRDVHPLTRVPATRDVHSPLRVPAMRRPSSTSTPNNQRRPSASSQ